MLFALLIVICPARAGVVLLYHHVSDSTPAITSTSPALFERQLDIIEEEGFRVLPLEKLVNAAINGKSDEKYLAITFDDAYLSIYERAFPMLTARGWPFTIFVATDLVGANPAYYLNWQQLAEMADQGATIANHSHTHNHLNRRLQGESREAWRLRNRNDIERAAEILSSHGYRDRIFAIPYGEYTLDLLSQLEKLGYIAFGQQSGAIGPQSNLQLLPRFPISGASMNESAFRAKLNSLPMPIGFPAIEPLTDEAHPALTLTFSDTVPAQLTCYGPGGLMQNQLSGENHVVVRSINPLDAGRSRYNCTLPAGKRFHWFSQLWIRKQDNGNWAEEPSAK
jgi:peptidoglycan/xylan/chitin deacetylase (PgdA/CDA1 family)